jgi:hypothetical protein
MPQPIDPTQLSACHSLSELERAAELLISFTRVFLYYITLFRRRALLHVCYTTQNNNAVRNGTEPHLWMQSRRLMRKKKKVCAKA